MQTAGSLRLLAERLQVPETTLSAWLEGVAPAPLEVYLAALDVVANGPFTKNKRTLK